MRLPVLAPELLFSSFPTRPHAHGVSSHAAGRFSSASRHPPTAPMNPALLRPFQLFRLPTSMQPVRQMALLTGAAIGKMKTVTVSRSGPSSTQPAATACWSRELHPSERHCHHRLTTRWRHDGRVAFESITVKKDVVVYDDSIGDDSAAASESMQRSARRLQAMPSMLGSPVRRQTRLSSNAGRLSGRGNPLLGR